MKRISHERFIGLLDRQLSALEAVREVLDREAQALQAGRPRLVEALRARKQRRLAAAAAIEQQRRECMPTPVAQELLAESTEVATRWAALLELTRVCRDLSEANACTCRRQQAHKVSSGFSAGRHSRPTGQRTDDPTGLGRHPGVSRWTWRPPICGFSAGEAAICERGFSAGTGNQRVSGKFQLD